MHEILQCQEECIRSRPGYHTTAGKGNYCGYDKVPDNAMPQLIMFARKSLSRAEWWYSNIEKQTLRILQGVEKFQHYCFAHEVKVITDHKPLIVIMDKDVAILSQYWQWIILCIHQYRIHILYKPGPKLYIADWLSHHNHEENKDRDTTVDLPVCTPVRHTRSNNQGCTPTRPRCIYHTWLATQKRRCATRHTKILAHQNNNTF